MNHGNLPPSLQNSIFTVQTGRLSGASHATLHSKQVQSPYHGVRAGFSGLLSLHQRCTAAALAVSSSGAFSHTTAAALRGLALPAGLETSTDVHVSVPSTEQEPRRAGVVGHHCVLRPVDRALCGNLPVTSPGRTWLDMAALLNDDWLVVLGDAMLRRRDPVTTLDQLQRFIAVSGRRRDIKRLREAVQLVRPGTDSPQETRLRLLVIRAGLPEPEVNVVLYADDGERLGRADMNLRRWKIVLEYEGRHHVENADQYDYDIGRYERMQHHGWRVMRFNSAAINDRPEETVRHIRRALLRRDGYTGYR